MCDKNKKQEGVPNPSYSMMHALEDSFSLVIYNGGTHDTNMFNGCVHWNHAVRLTLKKGKGAMWHETLYHSGAKSRERPIWLKKTDLRLFMYLWPCIANIQRNINIGTTDGVAREFSELL